MFRFWKLQKCPKKLGLNHDLSTYLNLKGSYIQSRDHSKFWSKENKKKSRITAQVDREMPHRISSAKPFKWKTCLCHFEISLTSLLTYLEIIRTYFQKYSPLIMEKTSFVFHDNKKSRNFCRFYSTIHNFQVKYDDFIAFLLLLDFIYVTRTKTFMKKEFLWFLW